MAKRGKHVKIVGGSKASHMKAGRKGGLKAHHKRGRHKR